MRTKGTKEIVATQDGRGFIALLENGELWRFNSMTSTWVRELNPEELAEEWAAKKAKEAEKAAQEAPQAGNWDSISFARSDRLEALALAQRVAGGVNSTADILRLARWVVERLDK
jgi:hypothetical protein